MGTHDAENEVYLLILNSGCKKTEPYATFNW